MVALGAGGWAFGAWLQGRLPSTPPSHRRLVSLAALLVATGPASVLAHMLTNLSLGGVVAGCIVMGAGMGIAYPRLSSAALTLARSEEQGAYSSALQAGESMGIGVTTALIAAVIAAGAAFTAVYAVLLGLACAAVLIAVLDTPGQRKTAS